MIRYSLSDFADVPVIHKAVSTEIAVDELEDVSSFGADVSWSQELVDIWETQAPEDRSTAYMSAAYLAAEEMWDDSQILSLLFELDDRWGKYLNRSSAERERLLRDVLERARARVGYDGLQGGVFDGMLEKRSHSIMDETEVLGFGDFVSRSYPIDWMFEGLLAHGGAGLITGWPGAGKTSMSLQVAASAALGEDFLGWKCSNPVRVLYLSLEMSAPPLHLFVTSAREDYTKEQVAKLNKNLLLAPFGVPMHVDKEEGYERLTKLIEKHSPDLIFIDSLSMMTPKDLTDEEAMKTLFDGLAVVRQETGVAFVILHHNRKKAADAQRSKGVELSDIYGSTYITAKVDFAVNLTKTEEKNVVVLTTLKNRLAAEPEPIELMRTGMRFSDPTAMSGFMSTLDT